MEVEKKWVYIATALVLLVLVSVPSAFFVQTFKNYFGFLNTWSGGVLRPARISSMPMPPRQYQFKPDCADIKMVSFKLKNSKAQTVLLEADFNMWKGVEMSRRGGAKDSWEISLPLPKGRYNYCFNVDGQEMPDPESREAVQAGGKSVSVKVVK